MSQKIERLKLTIPISPPLTPDEIANIQVTLSNVAQNRQQWPVNDIELTIMRAPETAGTQNQQQAVDAATATLEQTNAEEQAAITKEKQ